ncbi:ParB family protein [Photorhabdus africana]|uniref:ParB family protein n=1 Tax=Photorhabdus africana TaxID=3097554 RepID=UPI002B401A1B|nr:ParB family protein [Photorhabdus sp. CRI-LC]
MSKYKTSLSDAILQRGKTPQSLTGTVVLPIAEMPMVLTLDELQPNPDNPRLSRNPRFDDIKASVRARGLDSVPKVTRDPEDSGNVYIFSDGGNTRYQILCELWKETGEERFFRIPCLFKPWPGRLQCVIGHLAENDVRGDLTFIEKALGVCKASSMHEKCLGRPISQRELTDLLKQEGFPISQTSISQMHNTVQYLYPHMPNLLISGMGRPQAVNILSLRIDAQKTWNSFSSEASCEKDFDSVFGEVCQRFDNPEVYSFDMLRDELIGELIKALPHPALNYDRWLLELDPKERNRRQLFGEPPPIAEHLRDADRQAAEVSEKPVPPVTKSAACVSAGESESHGEVIECLEDKKAEEYEACPPKIEVQPDVYETRPTLSSELSTIQDKEDIAPLMSAPLSQTIPSTLSGFNHCLPTPPQTSLLTEPAPSDGLSFAQTGLEPVSDIWSISPVRDDIEHLQDMAFRLAFELAEEMGGADELEEAKDTACEVGYRLAYSHTASRFIQVLLSLTGNSDNNSESDIDMLGTWFIGSDKDAPVLSDVAVVKFMRLIRVLRRLRELQRELSIVSTEGDCNV